MHKLLIFSCTALFLLLSSASHAQDGCIDPDLINPNVLCPGIYAPVCGCEKICAQAHIASRLLLRSRFDSGLLD